MSEVKRWKLKGFIPGVDGESKAVFQPTVVLAEDYDAALAREAALRDKLQLIKNEDLKYKCLLEQEGEVKALKQRLTVAEQLLRRVIDSSVLSFEQNASEELELLEADICAALKPAEEGEGS